MYHYYLLVSAADGITAPFTSQTSSVHPTVIFTTLLTYSRLHYYRLVFADTDLKPLLTGGDTNTKLKNITIVNTAG